MSCCCSRMTNFRRLKARRSNLTRRRASPAEKRLRASSTAVSRWSLPGLRAGATRSFGPRSRLQRPPCSSSSWLRSPDLLAIRWSAGHPQRVGRRQPATWRAARQCQKSMRNSHDSNRDGLMVARSVAFALGFTVAIAAPGITQEPNAQEMPNPQVMQLQAQRIMQERPREAEAAARAFLMLVAPNLVVTLDSLKAGSISGQNQPLIVVDGVPRPGLSGQSLDDQYWAEVGQLTVQFGMVQNLNRRDS